MQLDRTSDHVNLTVQSLRTQSCAASCHFRGIPLKKYSRYSAARCSISDTHFSRSEQIVPLSGQFFNHMYSREYCLCRLLPRHGRFEKHIFCPAHHLVFRLGHCRYIHRHSDIHREKFHACDLRHQTYTCCAPGKVLRHNGSHFLSGLSHTLSNHTIVRAHNNKTFFPDCIVRFSSDTGHTHHRLFQLPKAVQRLAHCPPVCFCRLHAVLVSRTDFCDFLL